MRAGVVTGAGPGVEELAVRAEQLGFATFWLYDTATVLGDPFVALALCAKATSQIRLGIGVTSPALRSAPAAANAVASLNSLAPGRIVCGVGTGNVASRSVGEPPTTMARLEQFTESLQGLCAGGRVAYGRTGRTHEVALLDDGTHLDTHSSIDYVVAAFGLKAAAIAGRRNAGLISFGLLSPEFWRLFISTRNDATGDASSTCDASVITAAHVIHDGADPYGDKTRDAVGHIAVALLAFAAATPAFAETLSPAERTAVQGLLDHRGTTATAPDHHLTLYRNYLSRIDPEDRDLVLPSLIDRLALVGTRDEIATRIAELGDAGIDEIVIQPVIDPPAEMTEFASLVQNVRVVTA